ncbi:MAG: hypothetical protein ABJL99_00655 [Aliishimia sp.]
MSDYPNPNVHRGDGISGRGLLAAAGVIVFVIVLLAAVGSNNAPTANEATMPSGVAPVEEAPAIVAPVGVD